METSKSLKSSERLSFSDKRVDVFSNVCKQNNSTLNVMTSSRVVRGTKGRITLCVCALLIITGIIVCYNNTLSQLDDVRRANDQCHQQQENLSTQFQVIFDYKQRLEKSLKTEKVEHQQTKKNLENKLDEEKSKYEKTSNEANLKLSSVQQQYNMLQAEYDDYKEESSKMQQQQLNEINDLQSKVKEIQGQLKQSLSEKDNAFEHLKTQFLHLQVEKENLEKQVKSTQGSHLQSESEINHLTKINHELQRELEAVKAKHLNTFNNDPSQDQQKQPETASIKHIPSTNFSRQVEIGDSIYQIRDSQNNPIAQRQDTNVADSPSNADQHMQPDLSDVHKTEDKQLNYNQQINHNEVFNNNENVLAAPNNVLLQQPNQQPSSSTTSKTIINGKPVSKASLDAVPPLNLPTVTPESIKKKPSQESRMLNQDPHVLPLPFAHKKLPVGVVPVPKTPLEAGDESKNTVLLAHKPDEAEKDIREEVNNAFPNRYRANLILNELANEDKAIEADKQEQINEGNKEGKNNVLKSDVGDKENNALEVFDPPINDKERGLEGDPFGLDDNAHGGGDKVNSKQTQQKLFKQVNGLGLNGGGKLNEGHKVYDGQDGVDYDKDVQNDMQLEENDPEGEDDDPDYADHIAQHKDPAVRN